MTRVFADWCDRMEFAAFGTLALSLAQFEALTPTEFQHRLKAHAEQETRQFERLAQLACWVINPWLSGKSLGVRDLLQRPGERRRPADEGDEP